MDKGIIAIDIDGTLADNSGGFQGETVIGDPLPGAKEFLQALHDDGWEIMIHTCRAAGVAAGWLADHGLYHDSVHGSDSTPGKPVAKIYLDDRGITFTGNFAAARKKINSFATWNGDDVDGEVEQRARMRAVMRAAWPIKVRR